MTTATTITVTRPTAMCSAAAASAIAAHRDRDHTNALPDSWSADRPMQTRGWHRSPPHGLSSHPHPAPCLALGGPCIRHTCTCCAAYMYCLHLCVWLPVTCQSSIMTATRLARRRLDYHHVVHGVISAPEHKARPAPRPPLARPKIARPAHGQLNFQLAMHKLSQGPPRHSPPLPPRTPSGKQTLSSLACNCPMVT